MRVLHVNQSDHKGGAARAAMRIHKALLEQGVDSRMLVSSHFGATPGVSGPQTPWARLMTRARPQIVRPLLKTLQTNNTTIHSVAALDSALPCLINRSDADTVNLHWTCGEMLSVADIGRIEKPIVWTLHDMWPFCGAEHYTESERWAEGYFRSNRPRGEAGLDLNRWTWHRKLKHWKSPMEIVSPSHWLGKCAGKSALMKDWPVSVIPNAIDTNWWMPLPKQDSRKRLGLPLEAPLLLFGADGGGKDPRKGFDLLIDALKHLRASGVTQETELVVFGQGAPQTALDLGFPVNFMGRVDDDSQLRCLYSAADALVVPSRQDNLPNTCVEAHACGLPVVAFHLGGIPDVVNHLKSGYLARPFNTEELGAGLAWAIERRDGSEPSSSARNRAVSLLSNSVVAAQYLRIYERCV